MTEATESTAERCAFLIYYARVMLREASARRHFRGFHATLLEWAGRSRREAAAIDLTSPQGDLFA